jgi:hypothetical protein
MIDSFMNRAAFDHCHVLACVGGPLAFLKQVTLRRIGLRLS